MERTTFATRVERWLSDYDAMRAQFRHMVFKEVRRHVTSIQDAEDLTEAVLRRVWARRGLFDPARSSFSHWIYLNLRTILIQFYRRWHEPPLRLELVPEDCGPSAAGPEELHRAAELRRQVREAVASLPWPESEVMRLRHLEGLPWDEVGRRMRMTARNAQLIERRARELLRGLLAPLRDESGSVQGPLDMGRVGLLRISEQTSG